MKQLAERSNMRKSFLQLLENKNSQKIGLCTNKMRNKILYKYQPSKFKFELSISKSPADNTFPRVRAQGGLFEPGTQL